MAKKEKLACFGFVYGINDDTLLELAATRGVKVQQRIFRCDGGEPTRTFVGNHYHDFYEMEIILSGKEENIIGNKSYTMCGYDYAILSPSDIHKCAMLGEDIVNITIQFDTIGFGDKTKRLLKSLQYPVMGRLSEDAALFFGNVIEKLSEARHQMRDDGAFSQLLNSLLEGWLIYVIKSNEHLGVDYASYSDENERIFEAVNYIKSNFRENISLSQLADSAGYNESYFSAKFKKIVGVPFKRFLRDLRLKDAYNRIVMTEDPVGVIAEEAGFSDFKNFSRCFLRQYGCSPTELRRKNKKLP